MCLKHAPEPRAFEGISAQVYDEPLSMEQARHIPMGPHAPIERLQKIEEKVHIHTHHNHLIDGRDKTEKGHLED